MERGHSTPADAARGDTPSRYSPVLGLSVNEDRAVVLLGTDGPPDLYPYEVHCYRENGLWHEGSGSNGCGWSGGVMTLWHESPLPDNITEVVVESRNRQVVVPVTDGYFLFVEWDWPDSDNLEAWPRVAATRTSTTPGSQPR